MLHGTDMVGDARAPWHGTLAGYVHTKCRCVRCLRANSAYAQLRYARLRALKQCVKNCGATTDAMLCPACAAAREQARRRMGVTR